MKLFVEGRKETFSILRAAINPQDQVIWFHVASLGEYEQGLPIINTVRELFPSHKIILSFFSPSGYEVKKYSTPADAVVYLPLDTVANAKEFLELAHPALSIFIKYDFWPNFLNELNRRNIPTLLVSGGFRADHVFFKSDISWFKKPLIAFDHFFVQNENSKQLLNSIGYKNVSISGDTRFDRVSNQLKQNNKLDFIKEFLDNKLCIVAGSSWPEEEEYIKNFLLQKNLDIKIIIAPHTIDPERIKKFQNTIPASSITFSEKRNNSLAKYQVLILDTIGLLTKVYSYADVAFVGGAVGTTGLHNILEPAAFSIPIVTGNNFNKFPEAKQLQSLHGLFAVTSSEELNSVLNRLIDEPNFRKSSGKIAGNFIKNNRGATQIIEDYLKENYVKTHKI
tara:strand:- start:54195 stop:55376 length:1182 start_codon:yes stop_codon:yes gene_type:complete